MMGRVMAAAALAVFFTGCDGLIGGDVAARIPLQADANGAYAPVRILLRPEMNTVVFSLHADFVWGKRDEAGQWNSYRATLSTGDKVVRAQEFQVNSPENVNASSSSPPASLQQPVLRVEVPAEAEYQITIAPLRPPTVTLNSPQLLVRINVLQL